LYKRVLVKLGEFVYVNIGDRVRIQLRGQSRQEVKTCGTPHINCLITQNIIPF